MWRRLSPNGDMKPSPTELVILKHLWLAQPQSLREIHTAIESELQWTRSSTRKTVDRMIEKGMLSAKNAHGLKVYRAKVKKIPTIASLIRLFASDVLGLDGPLPVTNLVKSKLLNDQELKELDNYLKQLELDENRKL
jgi:predicted transcriptional regulator